MKGLAAMAECGGGLIPSQAPLLNTNKAQKHLRSSRRQRGDREKKEQKAHRASVIKSQQLGGEEKEKALKMMGRGDRDDREGNKGLLWKLPAIKSQQLGKVGPAFGFGVGCGMGFGIGLLGGVGIGPGIPGLQVGVGLGAGCGLGLGFGYGVGKGIAHDEHRRYSNVGNFHAENVGIFRGSGNLPDQDDIGALVEEIVENTKKIVRATTREMEKWRR